MRRLIPLLLAVLTGCAGVRIEVKGFSPEFTERIVRAAYESQKGSCTNGIAAEHRDVVVESHTPRHGAPQGPRAKVVGEFKCN